MSSAIVTAILLTVMLLIVGSFVLSACLARWQHLRELKKQQEDLGTTGRMMMVEEARLTGIENA